jgi:hypothetical protein
MPDLSGSASGERGAARPALAAKAIAGWRSRHSGAEVPTPRWPSPRFVRARFVPVVGGPSQMTRISSSSSSARCRSAFRIAFAARIASLATLLPNPYADASACLRTPQARVPSLDRSPSAQLSDGLGPVARQRTTASKRSLRGCARQSRCSSSRPAGAPCSLAGSFCV